MNYVLSHVAEQDIDEILVYLATEKKAAALKFLDSLYEAMDMLAENPMMGHSREDLTDRPVRFWPFKWHYLIIYKSCVPIEIVRVLSGYRDISTLLCTRQKLQMLA
jgi:plasmid stabilization system protein ParE